MDDISALCQGTQSFLSNPVQFMLNGNPTKKFDDLGCYDQFFDDSGTYNWGHVEKLFKTVIINDSEFTYECGLNCTNILRPLWMRTEQFMFKLLQQEGREKFLKHLNWLGRDENLLDIPYDQKDGGCHVELILYLSSVFENALGNIYYTLTNQSPPHLLRDLINVEEFRSFFGSFPMFFVKIILGTPKCVNIRNLVWHGFSLSNEIPSYYAPVIILVMRTFSRMLANKELKILYREKITNISDYFDRISNSLITTKVDDEMLNLRRFKNSNTNLFPETHLNLWKRTLQLYNMQKYARCLLLLLPQLEHLLRIKYGRANQIDISARFDTYYIILDTILNETIQEDTVKPNKLHGEIDDCAMKLMYDVFVSPYGPRIRDKVSHGEVDLNTINRKICQPLIYLSLYILSSDFKIYEYESLYHLNSRLQFSINQNKKNIAKIKLLEIPKELEFLIDWNSDSRFLFSSASLTNRDSIKIFFRPARESVVVGSLHQICQVLSISCDNLLESLEERLESYKNKSLRSKRRQTLCKMLESLPKMNCFIENSLISVQVIFNRLQLDGHNFLEGKFDLVQRFTKQMLKQAENMSKCTHKSSNEWQKADKIFLDSLKLLEKFQILLR